MKIIIVVIIIVNLENTKYLLCATVLSVSNSLYLTKFLTSQNLDSLDSQAMNKEQKNMYISLGSCVRKEFRWSKHKDSDDDMCVKSYLSEGSQRGLFQGQPE